MKLSLRALISCALLLPLASFASAASGRPASEWTVEKADSKGLVLLWENRALGMDGESLVRSAALGVPSGARPVGNLEVLEEAGKTALPQAGMKSLQAPASGNTLASGTAAAGRTFSLSQPARYRDLEITALALDPAAGGKVVAKARIRIDFNAPGGARPAFAPAPETAPERHLQGWLLNYPQSRGFRGLAGRTSPVLAKASGSGFATGPAPGASLPKVRLVIKTRGDNIEVLDYDALRKAGVPMDKIDPRHMRLFHDGTEVPMFIAGGDDGRWHPGDYIEFIGKSARGDKTYLSLFASTSTFILTWEGGKLGLRAPAVPVSSRGQGPLAPGGKDIKEAPPFKASVHMEVDREILRIGSTAVEEIVDLGARVQETELTDFWMWDRMGAEADTKSFTFSLDYDPVAQGQGGALKVSPFRIKVSLKGITNNPKASPDHHVKFLLNGKDISLVDGVANDAIWEGQDSYTWVSKDLDPGVLKPGVNKNTLVLQKVNDLKANDGSAVEVQDAYLNWFELEFPSGYRAQGDQIRFSNDFEDSLGVRLFSLQGFSKPDLSVWDLGGRKLTGYRMDRRDAVYDIALVDSLAGPTRYIACALDKREVPILALDTLPELVSPSEGADYLVVTHRDLLGSALDSLLAHRKKQGLRCKVVLADHLYQSFGDGSMDPGAIRRFVEHAYRTWPRPAPAYLLLLGETSLWYEKVSGEQKTLVPTQLVNIHGWGVAATDDYFSKVSGDDAVSDLFVGRIPVASREDLSKVVRKTLALENRRPAGHWANKALLVSGFEESFMVQNGRLQALAAAHDRQYSRLDLYPKSPHYKSASERAGFFDQLDSAFSLVSFVGHGGGAVWSDAGVLTLRHLDEGRLKGEYPIPLVSSVTCLTGYFEDINARSLGEELIRLEKGGAAAFYGAAGYISNLAGEALSYEIIAAAASGSATAGSAVQQAETMVQLKTSGAFAPVLSEFNLLGDPALRLSFPPAEGSLDLGPRTLSGSNSLEIKGRDLSPEKADGVVTLLLGDSAFGAWPVTVSSGSFSLKRDLAGLAGPVPDGKALLHYWSNDGGKRESRIASAPFTTLDWIIDSVRMVPAQAAPGDSVTLTFRLGSDYGKLAVDVGVAFYTLLGGDAPPLFPDDNQVALRSIDGTHLETATKVVVPIPGPELTHPTLRVGFRMSVRVLDGNGETVKSISNLSSRVYTLPVSDLGRISFAEPAFRVPVQDTLGTWAVFRNSGLGKVSGFSVQLTTDAEGTNPGTLSKPYPGELNLGGIDSLFFPLADSLMAGRRVRAALVPSREGELADRGTVKDTVFRIWTRFLDKEGDSLVLDTATTLNLPSGGKPHRVFAERVTVTALPSHLSPAQGALPAEAWRVRSASLPASGLALSRSESAASPKRSAADRPYWHYQPEESGAAARPWLKLDTLSPGLPWNGRAWRSGLYGLFLNRDVSPPLIQFSSRGQALLEDDYVPQSTPINVVVRDAEGVDMSRQPPTLASDRQVNDSSTLASETSSVFPTMVRFNFIPRHGAASDSLTVTATDVSGNHVTRTLAYRRGEDLSIRNLGSYPNPFADTAVFVYSLTDYCEKVQLRIYSRAGRLVRTLEQRNVVGYQEVLWDGRAAGGGAIGNGLYFLKVTAHAGGKEATQVFKLFKKRRK